jgi:hypothetical protein
MKEFSHKSTRHGAGSLSSHRITGLTAEQLNDLITKVADALTKPWHSTTGRPRELDLADAVFVALVYARHNVTEELLGAFMGVDQATISRMISLLTPVIAEVTAPHVPTEQDATDAIRGRVALVDGALAPSWSWHHRPDLWAGKHKTTGYNILLITDLTGKIIYVTDPLPGHKHDMSALRETAAIRILAHAGDVIGDKGFQGSGYITPVKKPEGEDLTHLQEDFNNQISGLRAPVERAVAHIKNWKILHTDYRRPIHTWQTSFQAATGLYFFSKARAFA